MYKINMVVKDIRLGRKCTLDITNITILLTRRERSMSFFFISHKKIFQLVRTYISVSVLSVVSL